jgi:carboxylesterase type B
MVFSYRLGLTGFLTSEELRRAGYKANNGFHDQRMALKWIQKFIGGFGGDRNEVTVSIYMNFHEPSPTVCC